jgi:hypothetical protein
MKKLLFSLAFLFATAFSFAQSYIYVDSYIKSNGTFVQGHYRTTPNYTRDDNWSTIGNINPFTGAAGTKRGDYYTTPYYYINTRRSNYYNPLY